MAQFDACRLAGGGFVIDCQADVLRDLPTRFVVPLRRADAGTIRRLNPVFEIEGEDYAMVTQLAGAIDRRAMGSTVVSLAMREYEIKDALDLLISGF